MSQSFFTSIGGIKAAQSMIDVVSDNLANINTIGYKQSQVTFSDVYYNTLSTGSTPTSSTGGTNPSQIGFGTQVSTINRDFTSGATQSTGNSTDMAITGEGFFCVLNSNGEPLYTRAGNFTLDSAGNLVNANGYKALGIGSSFSTSSGSSTVKVPLSINTVTSANTTDIGTKSLGDLNNLDSSLGTFNIDITKPLGTTCSVPVDITGCTNMTQIVNKIRSALDTVGNGVDGSPGGGDDLFVASDVTVGLANGKLNLTLANGGSVSTLAFNEGTSTFLSSSGLATNGVNTDSSGNHVYSSNVLDFKQTVSVATSAASGVKYSEMSVAEDGKLEVKYSNGDKMTVATASDGSSLMFKYTTRDGVVITGNDVTVDASVATPANLQMATAKFINPQGLIAQGGSTYASSTNSGDATFGIPGSSGFSTFQSGTLESSNVDMTTQFANMIIAQRAIEANSRVFSTQNEILKQLGYMGQ